MRHRDRWAGTITFILAMPVLPCAAQPLPASDAPSSEKATPPAQPAGNDAVKLAARKHYESGRSAELSGNWQVAYDEYRAAFSLLAHWQIEGGLAGAAHRLGRHREAAALYRHLLSSEDAQKELSAPALADARKRYAESQQQVGRVRITGPAGAEVWIAGAPAGTLPLAEEVFADPGELTVEARRDGKTLAKVTVTVRRGELAQITLPDRPAGDAAASPSTTLPGSTPAPAPMTLAAKASAPGAPGAPGTGTAGTASRPGATSWPAVLALGGAAVVGAGVGAGLWIASEERGREAATRFAALPPLPPGSCSTAACVEVHDTLQAQANLQTAAAVTWAVAGAAGAAAVAVGLVTRRASPRTGVQAVPMLGAGTGGVVVVGSW